MEAEKAARAATTDPGSLVEQSREVRAEVEADYEEKKEEFEDKMQQVKRPLRSNGLLLFYEGIRFYGKNFKVPSFSKHVNLLKSSIKYNTSNIHPLITSSILWIFFHRLNRI